MNGPDRTRLIPEQLWHEETAQNSIERWTRLAEQQNWRGLPVNRQLLYRLFGASWYFTRYIFANGREAIRIIDSDVDALPDKAQMLTALGAALEHEDIEERTHQLRILKNGIMLQLLAVWMQERCSLAELERALTLLAEASLEVLITSVCRMPQYENFPVSVLAMGRMAGYEMTFGSDLDLIFLYDEKDHELYNELGKTIRLLLRIIAQPAAAGLLYEVDMRLRPHGNSGLLITSFRSFIEYHEAERDIWERQMMTRCRPILVRTPGTEPVLNHVRRNVYRVYDREHLRREILAMRTRVQKELGSPKDKYEIKRGYGGIMDIDFISHYMQLLWGHDHNGLQTCSTRAALQWLGDADYLDKPVVTVLLEGYDYLKKVETCLRLFDMKSVDSFRTSASTDNRALSRAMGHGDDIGEFLQRYESVTRAVRAAFDRIMN